MAERLTFEAARQLASDPVQIREYSFVILRTIAELSSNAETLPQSRELLIRALDQREHFEGLKSVLDTLALRHGLYPYASEPENLSHRELLAYETHRPAPLEAEGFVFHEMQARVYRLLTRGESVILSAPTSFGKSVIIDALVASRVWSNIVIVVPTIALIDETRRRLARFAEHYKMVTHPTQAMGDHNVLVMTQERLLEVPDLPAIDLFVIDEFYKLDTDTDSERSALLNQAFYRLLKTGAQYYLIGPNIDRLSIEVPEEFHARLMVTRFQTVAVDLENAFVEPGGERAQLAEVCQRLSGPTIIYVRSPDRARQVVQWLIEDSPSADSADMRSPAAWVAETFDPSWVLSKGLAIGVAMHHGRIPRALLHHIVKHFNSGDIRFLVCTSTLIEGVNTAAKNIILLDSQLARRPLDYFTFSNIRGRAGRMFRNFVGHVVLFHPSPSPESTTVDIPVASQSDKVSQSTLLHIEDEDLSPHSEERIRQYKTQNLLSIQTLRANRGVEPEAQLKLAQYLLNNARIASAQLAWTGRPDYEQLEYICELIYANLASNRDRQGMTARQLAARLSTLRRSNAHIPTLVEQQVRYLKDRNTAVENVLAFIRNWAGYRFPRYLMVVDRVAREVLGTRGLPVGSYGYYAGEVESLFLPPYFQALEEFGLPYQVAQKLSRFGLRGRSLDETLRALRRVATNPALQAVLSSFEQDMLADTIAGLGPETTIYRRT